MIQLVLMVLAMVIGMYSEKELLQIALQHGDFCKKDLIPESLI